MTNKKQDLSVDIEGGDIDQPQVRTDLDPISIVTEIVSDDPSVAELVAFRRAVPDLKFAAREAKRLTDEAMRLRLSPHDRGSVSGIIAGLTLIGLSFTAIVTIWPIDTLNDAEAKLALAAAKGPYHANEPDHVPSLAPATATRIRIKRAAYHVGELMVPPGPALPSAEARGLAKWPLLAFDLTTLVPMRGGPPTFADAQAQHWADILSKRPDFGRLADRVETLLRTSDRLFALAQTASSEATQLCQAAEGARIMAYMAAAQVAIWPVFKGPPGVAIKRRVAKLIDDRAGTADPSHMQAAIRMLFDDGSWLAKLVDHGRMATGTPTWTEIV
jgi:hypothetical protein